MKPTVLMLGWEYPPMINGGLGIASMGLAKALSEEIPVHLILPNAHPEQETEGVNIIGLDKIDLETLWEKNKVYYENRLQDLRLSYVNVPLSGYETTQELVLEEDPPLPLPPRFFVLKELYGQELPRRILDYSEISIRLTAELDFDIIHAHDWMTFIAAMEIKRETQKPLVLHVHSLEYDRGGAESKNWVFQLEKQAFEIADLILPVSHYTAEVIREHYGIDPKKIKAVHNAIEPLNPYRKDKHFKGKLVSFIGRLTHQKGPEHFFNMAMEILKQMDGVRFVVAGKGDALSALLDKASAAHIGDKFHFTGFLGHAMVLELLAMSDLCVMPSASEPFGLVALEATQMGVPCIIPFQSGAAEVLLNTPKFQAGDIENMAAQSCHILQDDAYREELVRKNQEDIKDISWEKVAQKILNYYKALLV